MASTAPASADNLARGVWPDVGTYGTNKMYYHHTFLPHSKQRTRALAAIAATQHEESGITSSAVGEAGRDVYTFGVYTGASVKFWHERLPLVGMPYSTQWGFDSFEGLPEEADGCELECKAWLPGAFSAADQFGVSSWQQCRTRLYAHVLGDAAASDHGTARPRLEFVKGFFSDSLTAGLASERQMRPALLIDMDVDLYISTKQALTWAFEEGIIVVGTFIYYDDVGIVKAEGGGELRAHEEATRTYGVSWHRYSDDLWRVVAIASPPGTARAVVVEV